MNIPDKLPKNADELKAQAKQAVRVVGDHLNEQANQLRDTAAETRYHAEDFIRNNPWPSVAIAVGFGFLLGAIVAKK
jgi:ElaB/YqjD/DUF883 family membrane-anchored ribosome-binding protein